MPKDVVFVYGNMGSSIEVDHDKRRKRRSAYYERKNLNPLQTLVIVGKNMHMQCDQRGYESCEGKQYLIPWVGDAGILIDRFDGRAFLDFYNPPTMVQSFDDAASDCEPSQLNFYRYRILVENSLNLLDEAECLEDTALEIAKVQSKRAALFDERSHGDQRKKLPANVLPAGPGKIKAPPAQPGEFSAVGFDYSTLGDGSGADKTSAANVQDDGKEREPEAVESSMDAGAGTDATPAPASAEHAVPELPPRMVSADPKGDLRRVAKGFGIRHYRKLLSLHEKQLDEDRANPLPLEMRRRLGRGRRCKTQSEKRNAIGQASIASGDAGVVFSSSSSGSSGSSMSESDNEAGTGGLDDVQFLPASESENEDPKDRSGIEETKPVAAKTVARRPVLFAPKPAPSSADPQADMRRKIQLQLEKAQQRNRREDRKKRDRLEAERRERDNALRDYERSRGRGSGSRSPRGWRSRSPSPYRRRRRSRSPRHRRSRRSRSRSRGSRSPRPHKRRPRRRHDSRSPRPRRLRSPPRKLARSPSRSRSRSRSRSPSWGSLGS